MSDSPTPKKTTTKRTAKPAAKPKPQRSPKSQGRKKPQGSKRPQGKGKKQLALLKKAGWYALAFLGGAAVTVGGQMLYDRTKSSKSSATNVYKLDKAA